MANKSPWEALDDILVVKVGCVRTLTFLLILISAVGASTQSPRDSDIEDLLKKLNKQPIKTLQSPDGEIIDCVDIYKQPAFDHPLLKNHSIEMRPIFDPGMVNRSNYSSEYAEPIWRQNRSCPKGTIPIRRVRKSDLFQAESFERFGMVHPNPYTNTGGRIEIAGAIMLSHSPLYYGVGGNLSVWKPRVNIRESTSSSITITKHGPNFNHAIHTGWVVHPQIFGNGLPRTFIAWVAREGNNIRGCINLLCSGFIQRNSNIVLGSPLPFSRTGRSLETLRVKINKSILDNWWVTINGLDVGYYPPEIFPNFDIATGVGWKGQVVNKRVFGHHTTTGMGSGRFANTGYGRAAHFENMVYADQYDNYLPARNLQIIKMFPRCYNAILHPPPSETSEPRLFFGGPGGQSCDQEPSG